MIDPSNDPTTVVLRGTDEIEHRDAPAAEDITPGELVEIDANGEVAVASANGTRTPTTLAIEARYRGMIADDTDSRFGLYDAGEWTHYGVFDSGHEAYAFLDAGESVSEGDDLVSAGNGAFRSLDTAGGDEASAVIAQAAEAVDNSGGSEPVRLRVRFY